MFFSTSCRIVTLERFDGVPSVVLKNCASYSHAIWLNFSASINYPSFFLHLVPKKGERFNLQTVPSYCCLFKAFSSISKLKIFPPIAIVISSNSTSPGGRSTNASRNCPLLSAHLLPSFHPPLKWIHKRTQLLWYQSGNFGEAREWTIATTTSSDSPANHNTVLKVRQTSSASHNTA